MALTFTRKELYEKVWQEPISKLAKEFGLSDRGLTKLCDRHQIPTPERGHWAKLAAGKPSPKIPLPDSNPETFDHIVIHSTVKSDRSPREEVLQALAAVPTVQISVPKQISKPHSIVQRWIDEHERGILRDREYRNSGSPLLLHLGAKPFTGLEKRRHRILSSLFLYMERQGYKAVTGDRKDLFLVYQGVKIEISLVEKIRQYRRPLTDKEKLSSWLGDSKWRQEKEPTGRLVFKINSYLEKGLKTEWLETEATAMEDLLPDIVKTLLAAGPLLLERQREREKEQRQWQEAADARRREEERVRRNQARWEKLLSIAGLCAQAAQAKTLVEAMERRATESELGSDIGGQTLAQWIAWAKEWIAEFDLATIDPEKVFNEVSTA